MEKLEQILYKPRQILEAGEQVYKSSDLEQLSVVVLYTGKLKKEPKLNILDFPASGFQIHFHETEDGIMSGTKIKPYKGTKADEIPLTNYQVAMADLYAKLLGTRKIEIEKIDLLGKKIEIKKIREGK